MEYIVALVIFAVGILVGTHFYLWVQALIFLGFIIYFNSSSFARLEIGGIFVFALIAIFLAGMFVGDISYAFQTDAFSDANLSNPFVVGD